MVDENELRVIHYTLGPLKPWDWWTSWLVKPVDVWQNVREQLEESLPGTGGGQNPKDNYLVKFLFLLPFCAVLFCCYRSFLKNQGYFGSCYRTSLCDHVRHLYYRIKSGGPLAYTTISTSTLNSPHKLINGAQYKAPAYMGSISVCVCLLAAVVSLGLALLIVPRIMTSQTPSSLSHHEYSDDDSGKVHQRQMSSCNAATWFYGLGMAFLAIATPSLPFLFGITALFLRLALMVVGGLILTCFLTYSSEHLAIRSFLKGLEERDASRNANFCC